MSPVKKYRIAPGQRTARTRSAPDLNPWQPVWWAKSPVESAAVRAYLNEQGIGTLPTWTRRTEAGVSVVNNRMVFVRPSDVAAATTLIRERPDLFPPPSSYAADARSPSKAWATVSSVGLPAQIGCIIAALFLVAACLLLVGLLTLAAWPS